MSQQTPGSDGPYNEQSFQNTDNQMPVPFHWQMNFSPYPYNFFNPFYNFNYPRCGYNFNDPSSMNPGGLLQPPSTLFNDRQLEYTTALSDPFASTSSPLADQTEAERLLQNSRSAVFETQKNAESGQALAEMSRGSGKEFHNEDQAPRTSGMKETPSAPRLGINHASSNPSPSALLPQLRQKAKESIVRHKHGAASKARNAVSTTADEQITRIPSPFMERMKQATAEANQRRCIVNQPPRTGHAEPLNEGTEPMGGQQKSFDKASALLLDDGELPSDAEITAEWTSACQDLEDLLAEGRAGAAANTGGASNDTSRDPLLRRPSHCVGRTRGCSAESGEIESTTAESDFPSVQGSRGQAGQRSSTSDDGGVSLGAQHPKTSLGSQSNIKAKGHGNANVRIQRELVDSLGPGVVENRGEKEKDNQTVSPNSEEVREWLEITGFYHMAYRKKTLDHCRDLKELEDVKERLLKGAATVPPPKVLVKTPLALTSSLVATPRQAGESVFKSAPFIAGTRGFNESLPAKPPLVASTRVFNETLPPRPSLVGSTKTHVPTHQGNTLSISPSSSRRNRLRGGRRRGNKVTQHAESLLKRSRAEIDWETTEEPRKKIARTEDPKSRDSKQITPAPTRVPTSPASASRRAWASSRVYDSYHPAGERRGIASPSGHRDSRRREEGDLFDQPGRRHDSRDNRSSRLEQRDRSADRQGKDRMSSRDRFHLRFSRSRSRSRSISERNSSGKGIVRRYSEDRP